MSETPLPCAPRDQWFIGIWWTDENELDCQLAVVKIIEKDEKEIVVDKQGRLPVLWPDDWRPL